MGGGPRPLPGRPNLRYLKLEAKRRLGAGEFPALHDAQLAIAWEHGQPSWAALKWAVNEMEARYRRLAGATARNIRAFNETGRISTKNRRLSATCGGSA